MSARDTVRSNKTRIVEILSSDQTLILNKVYEKNLITLREYNNLKCINKANTEEHVIRLVDNIMNKGEDTCQTFLNLLQTDDEIKSTYPELKNLQLNNRPLQADAGESRAAVELEGRLNNKGYKNWLKAGRCLLILKQHLHPYIDQRMKDFHGGLFRDNAQLRDPCRAECKPKMKKFSPCNKCTEWKRVIEVHQRKPAPPVNWDNCVPPSWRTDHWEVAKAYMPRGQVKVRGAAQFDSSALLHLIKFCDCFSVDQEVVTKVILSRNDLMHSAELSVEDDWITDYQTSLKKLVQQFNNEPQMATVIQQIDEMLAADLSIIVSKVDLKGLESDSDRRRDGINRQSVVQWEAELLQERLRELQDNAAAAADDDDDDDSATKDTDLLKSLVRFLQASKDLHERFSAELQSLSSRIK